MQELGRVCRAIRRCKGLSQGHCARLLGISNAHLSNVELGKRKPSVKLLDQFQATLGVNPHALTWILFGDIGKLPAGVQEAASRLTVAWEQEYAGFIDKDSP